MAAQIEQMFSVKQTPWHNLGKVIGDAPSVEAGIELAGLNWTVRTEQLMRPNGVLVDAKATVRDSDNKTLGIVGMQYQPLQNNDAFKFFQPFVDSGEASLETAGSLYGGSRIWVQAKLNKAPIEIGKNDPVEKYLLLSNGHDGSLAVRVGFTPRRVVCANTLSMAHADKGSQLIRIVHSLKVAQNLESIRETIDAVDAKFEASAEQMRFLRSKDINQEDLKKYIEVALDLNLTMEDGRANMRAVNLQSRIEELFEIQPGAREAGTTWWNAYNAVNYFLNHEASRTDDTRLNNMWFGSAKTMDNKAFELAVNLAA
jgi:phage/plasmid-like protein (TIGR03299 family)